MPAEVTEAAIATLPSGKVEVVVMPRQANFRRSSSVKSEFELDGIDTSFRMPSPVSLRCASTAFSRSVFPKLE